MSKHGMTNPGSKKAAKPAAPKKNGTSKKEVASGSDVAVTSESASTTTAAAATPPAPKEGLTHMELELVRSTSERKNPRLVIYNIAGRKGSVQFLSTLFGGDQKSQGNPPEKLTLIGEFAEPKVAKPKETPEERKARLAALPKPTLAEKVAKAEERAAKLRAKLAKAAEAPAEAATA